MKLIWIAIIASVATGAFAQSQPRAEVFPSAQIHDQLEGLVKQAESSGSSGATLGEYGTHAVKISERAASGGAEMHAHFVDIFYVTAGKATLIPVDRLSPPAKETTEKPLEPEFSTARLTQSGLATLFIFPPACHINFSLLRARITAQLSSK